MAAQHKCPSGSRAYMVRFVHKIAPSDKDVMGPVCINDNAFSNRNTLAAALRKAKVLASGAQITNFRVEGEKVIAFPNYPGHWHSITLTPADDVGERVREHGPHQMMSRRQPSLPGFPDMPDELEIKIPNMPWEQIDGDMDAAAHGGTIAMADGDHIELLKIQPVREYVGDGEAAEVGFPFWTKEAWFDLADLDLKNDDVRSALDSIGIDLNNPEEWFAEKSTPEQRALTIASALLDYGRGDEGPSGWSEDLPDYEVKWSAGKPANLRDYLADEDDEFIRDVLLDDFELDVEMFNREEDPTNGFRVVVNNMNVEITEWQDIEDATGEEAPEGEKVVRQDATAELGDVLDPKGKHHGALGGKRAGGATLRELVDMDDKEREETIIQAALAYISYGRDVSEEYVDAVGD